MTFIDNYIHFVHDALYIDAENSITSQKEKITVKVHECPFSTIKIKAPWY